MDTDTSDDVSSTGSFETIMEDRKHELRVCVTKTLDKLMALQKKNFPKKKNHISVMPCTNSDTIKTCNSIFAAETILDSFNKSDEYEIDSVDICSSIDATDNAISIDTVSSTSSPLHQYDISKESNLDDVIKCLRELQYHDNKEPVCRNSLSKYPRITNHTLLNNENVLILKLLSMNESEREKYLIKLAYDKDILVGNNITNTFFWNDSITKICTALPSLPNLNDTFMMKPTNFLKDINAILTKDKIYCNLSEPIKLGILFHDNSTELMRLKEFVNKLVDAKVGNIINGYIRINYNNYNEAYLTHSQYKTDIFFCTMAIRKNAMHYDKVSAFVLNEQQSDKTIGFVIEIIEENCNRTVVGTILRNRKKPHISQKFQPRDSKIPTLYAETDNKMIEKSLNSVYLLKIVNWQHEIPIVQVLSEIGKIGNLETEKEIVLLVNNIKPYIFTENILNYCSNLSSDIPTNEYAIRENLSKKCIFTIDPTTARDLDDAVSCSQLFNGNYEIGVHIADVSYFIPEESELDNFIANTTTSVYMVDNVYHMLPQNLCDLCSLLPGIDKLAYSVIWEITSDGDIVNTKFVRSIINSCVKLDYDQAQNIIDDNEFDESTFPDIKNGFTIADVSATVRQLHKIGCKLREKRFLNGSIKFDKPKIRFELNSETGFPLSYKIEVIKDSNRLIEEFMILANQCVAQFIYDKCQNIAVLRNHPAPGIRQLENIVKQFNENEFIIDERSPQSIYESAIKYAQTNLITFAGVKRVIDILFSRIFNKASYFCCNPDDSNEYLTHYALGIPIYTHFTSPIRRYPDILVHRALGYALNISPMPKRSLIQLDSIVKICNAKKFDARSVDSASVDVHFMQYIKSLKHEFVTRAIVMEIYQASMEIVLIETGHQIKVKNCVSSEITYSNKIPATAIVKFKDDNQEQSSELKLKVFSELNVEVCVLNNTLRVNILRDTLK